MILTALGLYLAVGLVVGTVVNVMGDESIGDTPVALRLSWVLLWPVIVAAIASDWAHLG